MKKFSRAEKIGVAASALFFILGASWFYLICTLPLPVYAPYKVWISKGAQVESRKDVKPGTFTITKSLAEIKEKAGRVATSIMVVYNEGTRDNNPFQIDPRAIYWLPVGNGVFYFAEDYVPHPSS